MPKNTKTKRVKKEKVWWLRKGGEGFLSRNLWMNGANARLQAKGLMLNNPRDKYKVIPCTLTYTLPITKTNKK